MTQVGQRVRVLCAYTRPPREHVLRQAIAIEPLRCPGNVVDIRTIALAPRDRTCRRVRERSACDAPCYGRGTPYCDFGLGNRLPASLRVLCGVTRPAPSIDAPGAPLLPPWPYARRDSSLIAPIGAWIASRMTSEHADVLPRAFHQSAADARAPPPEAPDPCTPAPPGLSRRGRQPRACDVSQPAPCPPRSRRAICSTCCTAQPRSYRATWPADGHSRSVYDTALEQKRLRKGVSQ
jgi:hypothetical protein